MTSVSAGHIILTPTQPVGGGRPELESNPGPPHQESCAVPTERNMMMITLLNVMSLFHLVMIMTVIMIVRKKV